MHREDKQFAWEYQLVGSDIGIWFQTQYICLFYNITSNMKRKTNQVERIVHVFTMPQAPERSLKTINENSLVSTGFDQ